MMTVFRLRITIPLVLSCLNLLSPSLHGGEAGTAKDLVRQSGVEGGLIVHVGCGDAKWTSALRISERYVVQGLEMNTERVAEARANVRNMGVSGGVSVMPWTGEQLPWYCGNHHPRIFTPTGFRREASTPTMTRPRWGRSSSWFRVSQGSYRNPGLCDGTALR